MSIFIVKGIKPSGEHFEENFEAADRIAAGREIKRRGDTVLSVETADTKPSVFSLDRLLAIFHSVKTHDKIIFARNLSAMIKAGLSITRALSIMEKQAKKVRLKLVLISLGTSISEGKTLSESMKVFPDVFSALFVSMTKAGEESGGLADALAIVGLQMDKTYALQRKIRGAMMYPAVVICVMILIGALMMIFVVPTLTETFTGLGVELPLSTRTIIGTSNFLRNYPILLGSALLALVALAVMAFKTKKGKQLFDLFLLRAPIVSPLVKEVNSARTARTLSSLLSSGVDIVVAIGITKDVIQNSYYKTVLDTAEKKVEKGELISEVFIANEKLYPLFVGEMINVGEETGKIGEMLLNVAVFYEDDVDQRTKDMSTLIEPILMVLIGTAVGFFAISVIGPIYSLADAI